MAPLENCRYFDQCVKMVSKLTFSPFCKGSCSRYCCSFENISHMEDMNSKSFTDLDAPYTGLCVAKFHITRANHSFTLTLFFKLFLFSFL